MKSTIDGAGRVVIPKALREAARLRPGTQLEVRLRDGVLEIEPAPLEVRVKRLGRLTIAVPAQSVPPLAADAVEATRRQIEGERGLASE